MCSVIWAGEANDGVESTLWDTISAGVSGGGGEPLEAFVVEIEAVEASRLNASLCGIARFATEGKAPGRGSAGVG